jgi:hypothetical protein
MNKNKSPSDLTKGATAENSPQLTEAELGKVAGGFDIKIGDIKGESMDSKHPAPIEILSFKKP